MSAVFIAHTKVLIAIRVSSKHKKLQITLPKLDRFLHRIFTECARSFCKMPFLFLDDTPIAQQKNLLQAEVLCSDAIAPAVRSLLPIKDILNEYLADDVSSSEPVIDNGEPDLAPITPVTGGASANVRTPEPVYEPVAPDVAPIVAPVTPDANALPTDFSKVVSCSALRAALVACILAI